MQLKSVQCTALEKINKQQVYVLSVVTTEDEYQIFRNYTTFFDFRSKLAELSKQQENVPIPELLDLKWFERALGKASEKRRRQINEFCKSILDLPTEISQSEPVHQLFKKWPSDETEAVTDSKHKKDKNEKKRKSVEKTLSAEKHLSKDLMKEMHDVQKTRKVSCSSSTDLDAAKQCKGQSHSAEKKSTVPSHSHPPLMKKISNTDSIESLEQYVVIEDVAKSQDSHLALSDGDTVQVLEKNLSGWWFVVKDSTGEQGWAPGGVLQPLDPNKHDADIDTEDVHEDECPLYEAISDYTAKSQDEVTYRKSEQVEVLQMRTDGWWKVRNSIGTIGITPAVNLARISDGSGPTDPLYSDITMYSQQSIYKKKPPPKRNTSRLSLSELYAKVEKIPQKPAKPSPKEHSPSSLSYSVSTVAEKNRPQVPPKNLGLKQENYVEIEFNDDEKNKSNNKTPKFAVDSGVEYSEINPGTLPEKAPKQLDDPESHTYLNITRHSRHSYENVDQTKVKNMVDQFFEVIQDYNPDTKHRESLPAAKGDIIKVTRAELKDVMCVMCLKERVEAKPCEGWIPRNMLRYVNIEVVDYDKHGIPVVEVLTSPESTPSHDAMYADALRAPKGPQRTRALWGKKKDKKGEWFAGQMSRAECEELLKDANDLEFVIRESKHGNDDYSVSVKYRDTIKHFKVEKLGEGRYQIGGFIFKNLSAIVKHYTKQPLFNVESGPSKTLGKPYKFNKGKL